MNDERMDYVIVKTSYNWADEADFPSYSILTEEELQVVKLDIFNYFDDDGEPLEIYVGTNEYIDFTSYEDVVGRWSYEEVKLPHDDAKVVMNYMGNDFGECSIMRVWEEVIQRMEEDNAE